MKRTWISFFLVGLLVFAAFAAAPAIRKQVATRKRAQDNVPVVAPSASTEEKSTIIDPETSVPVFIDPSKVQPLPEARPPQNEPYAGIKQQIMTVNEELRAAVQRGADISVLRRQLNELNALLPAPAKPSKGQLQTPPKAQKAVSSTAVPKSVRNRSHQSGALQTGAHPSPLPAADLQLQKDMSTLQHQLLQAVKQGSDPAGLKQLLNSLMEQLPERTATPPAFPVSVDALPVDTQPVSTSVMVPATDDAAALPRPPAAEADMIPLASLGAVQEGGVPDGWHAEPPDSRQAAINEIVRLRKEAESAGLDVSEYDRQLAAYEQRGRDGTLDNNNGLYFVSTNFRTIPDYPNPRIRDSVYVGNCPGTVVSIEVTIDSIHHNFDGDLMISLISPVGTASLLCNRRGTSGDNFIGTVFSDAAATAISAGTAPFSGTFRPETVLSTFAGIGGNGWWKLEVADLAAENSGTLLGWKLQLLSTLPGDSCANAISISVPDQRFGSTCYYHANYDYLCPYSSPTGKDVVYSYACAANQQVTFSLCRSYYDTKLYIYDGICSGTPIACNDDASPCPGSIASYRSVIPCVSLQAGHTYYVVVDGFNVACGDYVLEAGLCPACDVSQEVNDLTECAEALDSTNTTEDCDGGCNNLVWGGIRQFGTIQCGETVFGSCFTYVFNGSSSRDTDWYRLAVADSDSVRITATAEFPVHIFLLDSSCAYVIRGTATGAACSTASFTTSILPPGVYNIIILPQTYYGLPTPLTYRLSAQCFPILTGARCENPQLVPEEFSMLGSTTCGYGNHYDATCAADYDGGEDRVYRWTVTHEGDYSLWLNPYGSGWTSLTVDTQCPPRLNGCLASNSNPTAEPYGIDCRHFTPGTYYISVDSRATNPCIPQYDLAAFRCYSCSPCAQDERQECAESASDLNYYSDCDGGCNNMDLIPRFESIECGQTVCGKVFTYNHENTNARDTDWYRFAVSLCDTVRLKVWGEMPLQLSIVSIDTECNAQVAYFDFTAACDTGRITEVLSPGVYYAFVAPSATYTYPVPVNYHLQLTCSPCTPGNTCEQAYTITDAAVITGQSTCGRGDDYMYSCLYPYDTGEDMVIQWNVTQEGNYSIWLDPLGNYWTGLSLNSQCPPSEQSCLATSAIFSATPHGILSVHLAAGTYWILVDTYANPLCIPSFNLTTRRDCLAHHAGYVQECEEMADTTNYYFDCNGACNNSGDISWQTLQVGDTVEGRCFTYRGPGFDARDTDWYRFSLSAADTIHAFAVAPFPLQMFLFDTICPYPNDYASATGSGCTDTARLAAYLSPGEYYLWIGPLDYSGVSVPEIYHAGLTIADEPGQRCASAIPLVGDTALWGQTTCARQHDYDNTCLGPWSDGADILYRWTVVDEGDYSLWMYPDTTWTGLALGTACPPLGDNCLEWAVATSDAMPYGIACRHLTPGTYYIVVNTYTEVSCIPDFGLVIDHRGIPSNDSCVHAEALHVPSSTFGRTICATPEPYSVCQIEPRQAGVWYTVEGTGHQLTASLCATDAPWDAQMSLFTCSCTDLTCTSESDDACDLMPRISWCSQPGESYWLLVAGRSGRSGEFRLDVTDNGTPCLTPEMCACWDDTLHAPGTLSNTTRGYGSSCPVRPAEDFTVKVYIPSAGPWTFNTCGSSFDTYLYLGTQCCGDVFAQNDDMPCSGTTSPQSTICVDLPVPGIYFATVEGFSAAQGGDFTLNVQPGGTRPTQVTGVTATTDRCDSIILSWPDVADEEVYSIDRDGSIYATVNQNIHRFADAVTGLHSYQIRSVNGCGWGMVSQTAVGSGQIRPAAVTAVTASDTHCDSVIITWSDVANEMEYLVFRNQVQISAMLPANTVRYADGTAMAGTTYQYTVASVNPYCQTLAVAPDSGTRRYLPGQAGNMISSDTLCDRVHLSWTDVDHETGYVVYRNGTSLGAALPANTTGYDDFTAVSGARYRYTVTALGAYCDGAPSLPDSGGVATIPGQVGGVAASDTRCLEVLVTWTDAANETGYRVLRNGTVISPALPANTVLYHDSTATPGQAYSYQVQSFRTYCSGAVSESDSGRLSAHLAAVSAVAASDTSCSRVLIRWTNSITVDSFQIRRNGSRLGNAASNATQFNDETALPGVSYVYRVIAFNACGAGDTTGADAGIRILPPVLTSCSASDTLCSEVLISWTIDPSGPADSIIISRNGLRLAAVSGAMTSYSDVTIPANTVAYYSLLATNRCGTSTACGDSGRAFFPASQVVGVTATRNRCDSVIIRWQDVASDTGYILLQDGSNHARVGADVTYYAEAIPAGLPHFYSVQAVNRCGPGPVSASVIGSRLGAPVAPTMVQATDNACEQISVNWSGQSGDIDSLRIYRDNVYVVSVPPSVDTWTDAQITGRHRYGVGALSLDCGLVPPTAQDSGTGHSPALPPANLAFVMPAVCDSIQLTWTNGGGEVDGYILYRDNAALDTSQAAQYSDHTVGDRYPHAYQVRAYNRACGASAPSAAVSGWLLPLATPLGDVPDTVRCENTYAAPFAHCSGVTADSVFISLNNGGYIFLSRQSPVRDSVSFSVSRTLVPDEITPNCRIRVLSYQAARIDTLESPPFIIHCNPQASVDRTAEIPADFFLDQNYPNPFNPQTQLRFGVPVSADVAIDVFDVTGRKVATLAAGRRNPGVHTVVWNCADCSTGMYLVRMQSGNRVFLIKALLMK